VLCFIDESGDPGLKLGSGSSPYFVVALVLFNDNDEALAADQRIGLLRQELRLHKHFEFRFNHMKRELREAFFKAVAPYEFFYFGIVINKARLYGPGFKFRESFYKYACGPVFENAKAHLSDAIVVIDGSGTKRFRRQLGTYLRSRMQRHDVSARLIRKVKMQDSRSTNLIQMADMVSGAIARGFTDKPSAADYRRLIKHHEIYVQLWPRE
jgi:hypothetical protein